MLSASELVHQVKKLASLPDVYIRVQQLLDDPRASASDIGKVIGSDPALTARLLKIANSPFFGMAAKIETISRAIAVMGTQQLHDLVLASSVTSAFENKLDPEFNMQRFWTNSLNTAVRARLLAFECNVLDSERLFVTGLLHDIGHLAMYQIMPQRTAEAAAYAEAQKKPIADVERSVYFGFDYAEIGGLLLKHWNLPPMIQEAIACQNAPGNASQHPFETSIIHCAIELCKANAMHGNAQNALASIAPSALQQTGIDETRIDHIETQTQRHIAETMSLFLPAQRVA